MFIMDNDILLSLDQASIYYLNKTYAESDNTMLDYTQQHITV